MRSFCWACGAVLACLFAFTFSFLAKEAAAQSVVTSGHADVAVHGGDIAGTVTLCGSPLGSGVLYIPGTSYQARTSSSGEFLFNYVQPGSYTIVVESGGSGVGSIPIVPVVKGKVSELSTVDFCADQDNDGHNASVDCNDQNPLVFPGAAESCDGLDNNCDGTVDEGCPVCTDADSDGFFAQAGCGSAVDCDDANSSVSPATAEVCFDSIDNDCDGEVNEGCLTCTPGDLCDSGSVGQCATGIFDSNCQCVGDGAENEVCDGLDNDCNGIPDDVPGLESDPLNCGQCGNACGAGQNCVGGQCVNSDPCAGVSCNDGNDCTLDSCSGGACQFLPLAGATCGENTCEAGTQTQFICNSTGSCVGLPSSCGLFACGTGFCNTVCTNDSECSSAAYCAGGVCLAKLGAGAACGGSNECVSGMCSSGVCG
ncbi:MAG: hypothetical protein J5J00_11160 [Deltaproteobacteria bacterium]|nr:hypothetical protein [Deltaproteobacteria bacterium]